MEGTISASSVGGKQGAAQASHAKGGAEEHTRHKGEVFIAAVSGEQPLDQVLAQLLDLRGMDADPVHLVQQNRAAVQGAEAAARAGRSGRAARVACAVVAAAG
jgi:hypothetical protein